MIIAILLEKILEALKDEFSEFGHTVPEQKAITRQSEPIPQTVENKQTAETQAVDTRSVAQDQQAQTTLERVTPKMATRTRPEAI